MNRNRRSFAVVVVVAVAAVVAAAQESRGLRKMKQQQTAKLRIPLALDMLWKIKSF